MSQDETSVIDERTTAGVTPAPAVVHRKRPAVLAAAAAAVVALAVGAVVWSTNGATATSADGRATGSARSSGSAVTSDADPSLPAAPGAADASAPAAGTIATLSGGTGASSAAPAPLPEGWGARSFQGVTFSVPPGAVAPDVQDPGNADVPPSFVWTGPSLGDGINAQITVRVSAADQAPPLGSEYQSIPVPGADEGHMRTGIIDSQPPLAAVDVIILSGNRFINVAGMFAAGPEGEQMVRDLLASLRIG